MIRFPCSSIVDKKFLNSNTDYRHPDARVCLQVAGGWGLVKGLYRARFKNTSSVHAVTHRCVCLYIYIDRYIYTCTYPLYAQTQV